MQIQRTLSSVQGAKAKKEKRVGAGIPQLKNSLVHCHRNSVEIHFRWRPQLRDADDEMIFEAAINVKDRTIVTFNTKDFAMAADKFDVTLLKPRQLLENMK